MTRATLGFCKRTVTLIARRQHGNSEVENTAEIRSGSTMVPWKDRHAEGKEIRNKVPRESHAEWKPGDVLRLLSEFHEAALTMAGPWHEMLPPDTLAAVLGLAGGGRCRGRGSRRAGPRYPRPGEGRYPRHGGPRGRLRVPGRGLGARHLRSRARGRATTRTAWMRSWRRSCPSISGASRAP